MPLRCLGLAQAGKNRTFLEMGIYAQTQTMDDNKVIQGETVET